MKKSVETHWHCKSLLCSAIFAISLVAFATSAMAFGGGGKSRKSTIYKGTGVNSVGIHIGTDSFCANGYDKIRNKCFKSCEASYKHDKDGSCTICAPNEDGTTNAYLSYKDDPCDTATPLDTSCRTDCYCCNSGTCASWEWKPNDEVFCRPGLPTCTSNNDCSDGEYCNLNSTIKNQGNAVPNIGTCLPIGEKKAYEYNNNGFVASVNRMSWWAAENWCKAQGLELAELADIGFDKNNAGSHFNSEGNCGSDLGACHSGNWSEIQKAFYGVSGGLWTQDQYKTTHEYAIHVDIKGVDFWFRYSKGNSALCKGEIKNNQICNIYKDCMCTEAYSDTKCTECADGYEKDEHDKCVLSCPTERMCDGVCCAEGSTCEEGVCCMTNTWGDHYCCDPGQVAYAGYTNIDKDGYWDTFSCCYGTPYLSYGTKEYGTYGQRCCPTHSGAKLYCAIKDDSGNCTATHCCTGTVKKGEGLNGADECFAITGCMSNSDCSSNEYCHLSGTYSNYPDTGVCKPKGSYNTASLSGLGTVITSNTQMSWWAANNWCKAQGRSLISMADLGCYHSKTDIVVGADDSIRSAYGYCHKANSQNYDCYGGNWPDQCPRLSDQIRSVIKNSDLSYRNFWTSTSADSTDSGAVYHFMGGYYSATVRNRENDEDWGYVYAMCK